MKHYQVDWAKSKSRALLRSTIEDTLLDFRKPKQLNVLCFAGIDAAEIYEVYDLIGIPRENITCLEKDKHIARAIERQNLGISVVSQSLEDYVRKQSSFSFDVVSLDYTGGVSEDQICSIGRIARLQQRNHFVLHSANSIKRDPHATGLYEMGHVAREEERRGYKNVERKATPVESLDDFGKGHLRYAKNIIDIEEMKKRGENLGDTKRSAYGMIVRMGFQHASTTSQTKLLKWVLGEEYNRYVESLNRRVQHKHSGTLKLEAEDLFLSALPFPILFRLLEQESFSFFRKKCDRSGIPPEVQLGLFYAMGSVAKEGKFFRDRSSKSYSYISESGTPMVGDIYFLSYPRYAMEQAKTLAVDVGFPDKFKITDPTKVINGISKYFKLFLRLFPRTTLVEAITGERIFLGSSARPVLTKEKAIEEFQNGRTVDEIRDKYRGVNGKPLAQWKAHVTMGTYQRKSPLTEDIIINEEDSNLERITKEEALELLSEGIPSAEIHDAYPTSFTKGQLSAFKAHMTMGTYSK